MRIKTADHMTKSDWQAVRVYCLEMIYGVYGIDYNPEWHSDLDAMGSSVNVYLPKNEGWFIVVCDNDDAIIACAGLRNLATRPVLYDELKNRWPGDARIGALWRSYVTADHQKEGIGTMMKQRRIDEAKKLDYEMLYLHASRKNPIAVSFGQKFNFVPFREDEDGTIHMDRLL